MFRKIIRFLKRKYSLKYYENYCRVNKRPPYNEPLKEHFITHNLYLFLRNKKYPEFHTDLKISYRDIPFKESFSKIRKKYGNPEEFAVYRMGSHALAMGAFKKLVLNEENKIVLYFFDEVLVQFEYLIFHLKEKEYKDVLQRIVINKYLPDRAIANYEGFYIEDNEKNQISVFWNGFDLSIKFLCSSSGAYCETFVDYYNNFWKQKKKKPEDQVTIN